MTFEVGKTYRTKGGWNAKVESTFQTSGKLIVSHLIGGIPHYVHDELGQYVMGDPRCDLVAEEPDYETRLRDQAALAALKGSWSAPGSFCIPVKAASGAYDYADAFMAERKKRIEN